MSIPITKAICISAYIITMICFLAVIKKSSTTIIKEVDSSSNKTSPTTIVSSSSRFVSSAKRCDNIKSIPMEFYKSQDKEDKTIMSWFMFNLLCEGTYMEIGGLDGVQFSNTFVFNKALKWKGVLVELKKSNYQKLEVNRPNDVTIHGGVCSEAQVLHWCCSHLGDTAVSGIYEFSSPSFRQKWWGGVAVEDMDEIDCNTLDSLLLSHSKETTYFDFWTLDVEGAEFEVLKSVDFDRIGFGVVVVEADEHNEKKNEEVKQILVSNGYEYLRRSDRSDWFVNVDFYSIYVETGLVISHDEKINLPPFNEWLKKQQRHERMRRGALWFLAK